MPTEPIKTPEQLSEERSKRYINDPESFIELHELICGVIKTPGIGMGVSCMVAKTSRTNLDVAQMELMHRMNNVRMNMDLDSAVKSKIVKPGGMMSRFARGKK